MVYIVLYNKNQTILGLKLVEEDIGGEIDRYKNQTILGLKFC